jgi:hypothetical protein
MRILSEQEAFGHHGEDLSMQRAEELLRVYHSPNSARRLSLVGDLD